LNHYFWSLFLPVPSEVWFAADCTRVLFLGGFFHDSRGVQVWCPDKEMAGRGFGCVRGSILTMAGDFSLQI
jgi:hypothetical protein